MTCPRCQHENDATARFCEECGTALGARTCANCDTEIKAAAKFCPSCGTPAAPTTGAVPARDPRAYTPKHLADKILRSKSALEGERKQVTVLFADVKGSMELAEQLDPEQWHAILERFFEILTEGIHRFEGTVNQYTGDGIMALFGAPIAHEDHAQRACYAAVHVRDTLKAYADTLRMERGLDFSTRIGINSGEVVVGRIGDDLRMDYTAQGHTVGLASRIEGVTAANTASLSAATALLVTGYFTLRDLGETRFKGVREPVGIYELQDVGTVRTRFDASRARGLSRFVGRNDDLHTLETALAHAGGGRGQVVGIVAEAGTGKSRLCFEFLEQCRTRGHRVIEGRAVAHGKHIPLLPVLQIVRTYFGITDGDADRTVREKIAGKLLLLDRSFEEALPVVFELLGVSDAARPPSTSDPDAKQRQLFAMLHELQEADTREQTDITLIEDLHWLDGASEAWVRELVRSVLGRHQLLLVNFRPEFHAEWTGMSHYQQIALQPLGHGAVRELLEDLLGNDPTLANLAETIHTRTAGNPFFTEEVVQSLIESGNLEDTRGHYRLTTPVAQLEVPATVQPLLAGRIDRLAEREKRVLQTAAVIGKEVARPMLAAVLPEIGAPELDAALARLVASEFMYEQSLYPAVIYAFKHPLTQEVALGSQLGARRRSVHAAVARAHPTLHPNSDDEDAALIAYHWEQAGEPIEAARWYARAARWTGTMDAVESLRLWEQVRRLLAGAEDAEEAVRLGIEAGRGILNAGWRGGGSTDFEEVFEQTRRLCERANDCRSLAILWNLYGNVHGNNSGDHDTYLDHARKAVTVAETLGDPVLVWVLRIDLSVPVAQMENFTAALRLVDPPGADIPSAPEAGADVLGFSPHIGRRLWRGWYLIELGRLHEAQQELAETLRLARYHGEGELECLAETMSSMLGYRMGVPADAMRHARRSVELAERRGGALVQSWTATMIAWSHLAHEAWDDAIRTAAEVSTGVFAAGGRPFANQVLDIQARAQLGLGRAEDALRTIEAALASKYGVHFAEAGLWITRARVLLRCGDAPRARDIEHALARARTIIDEFDRRVCLPDLHEARAEWARARDDNASALVELRIAHDLHLEFGATGHATRLAQKLA